MSEISIQGIIVSSKKGEKVEKELQRRVAAAVKLLQKRLDKENLDLDVFIHHSPIYARTANTNA
jgi:hypothetical protein